jgi:hypothetical protein
MTFDSFHIHDIELLPASTLEVIQPETNVAFLRHEFPPEIQKVSDNRDN